MFTEDFKASNLEERYCSACQSWIEASNTSVCVMVAAFLDWGLRTDATGFPHLDHRMHFCSERSSCRQVVNKDYSMECEA